MFSHPPIHLQPPNLPTQFSILPHTKQPDKENSKTKKHTQKHPRRSTKSKTHNKQAKT